MSLWSLLIVVMCLQRWISTVMPSRCSPVFRYLRMMFRSLFVRMYLRILVSCCYLCGYVTFSLCRVWLRGLPHGCER